MRRTGGESVRRLLSHLRVAVAMMVAIACGAGPVPLLAHDVPSDVKVFAFVRPVDATLQFLVRVPLSAMQDVDFPRKGIGYIDVPRADAALRTAASLWLADSVKAYAHGRALPPPEIAAVRVSLPSDPWFGSYDEAMAQLARPPLSADVNLYWAQGMLDVRLDYPIAADDNDFAIAPKLERLGLKTRIVLRYLPRDGAERAFELHGDPGLVRLDPRWHQAAGRFIVDGFFHILDGVDHLLFIACLVLPLRRLKPLAVIVTAFTLAHSITLFASALGFAPGGLWFPALIEALIAASIVYMALENIVGAKLEARWAIAFGFGLVHGFGFSFALRDSLQFAGSHLLTALLAFNVGVELGQLLVLLVLVPALAWLFRHVVAERLGIVIASVLIAHAAWHWLQERFDRLQQFPLPAFDAATGAAVMRGAMYVLMTCAALWFGRMWWRQRVAGGVMEKRNDV